MAALLAANVLIFLRPGALPKKAYVALNPNIFFKVRTHLCRAQLHTCHCQDSVYKFSSLC